MSGNIFISYRRSDSAKDARAIYERLRREFGENKVFIDLEGIEPGEDFVESLERQLDGCEALVALISRDWVEAKNEHGERRLDDENDFVRIELEASFRRGVKVFPVLIDGARPPRAAELPENLRPLVRRQAVVLDYSKFDADVARLARAIRKALERPSSAREAMAAPRDPEAHASITERVSEASPSTVPTGPSARSETPASPTGSDQVAKRTAEPTASPVSMPRESDMASLSEPIDPVAQPASGREISPGQGASSPSPLSSSEPSRLQVPFQPEPQTTLDVVEPGTARDAVSSALPVPSQWPMGRTWALVGGALVLLVLGWLVSRSPALSPTTETGSNSAQNSSAVIESAANEAADKRKRDREALYAKGEEYYFGRNGVKQSDIEAVKWYRMAAEQGDPKAQMDLGYLYRRGEGGLTQSDSEAVKWYRMAAEQGNVDGQLALAWMYKEGRGGLPKSEAVKWYRMAAEQGNPTAQQQLGEMYESGVGGVPQDRGEAVRFYRLAAAQGNRFAIDALRRLGERGIVQSVGR